MADRELDEVTSEPTDLVKLVKARSLLLVLVATSRETRTALDGAARDLKTNIHADLAEIIDCAEREIEALNEAIDAQAHG